MYGVILAGGSGTRLWPLSRERFPKQCIKAGSSGLSLFQEAVGRLQGIVEPGNLLVVTHREQKEHIALQLAELKLEKAVILEEPLARNTAPAIGLAAWYLARRDPAAVMAVLPSDHYIAPPQAFQEALRTAGHLAEKYGLVTFGIRPSSPETGYGYIKCGPLLPGTDACRVAAFVEKPDLKKAQEYLAAGGYLWNSGIFVFKLERLQAEYRRLLPEVVRLLDGIADYGDGAALEQAYSSMPGISIDYGIMERAEEIVVLPAAFTWSDLGSWEAYYQVSPKDANGNHFSGRVTAIDTVNSLVLAPSRLVCTLGVQEMAIIDTDDALLVCPRSRAQEVRRVVEQLHKENSRECLSPPGEERPWGNFIVLLEGDNYKVKQINVHPGKRLSLQRHHRRAEQWTVVQGRALVTVEDQEYNLKAGESITIPRQARHRVENTGEKTLRFIEVQYGDYLGEDDIERFADDYGRVPGEAAGGPQPPAAGADQLPPEETGHSRTTEAEALYQSWLSSDLVDSATKEELHSLAGKAAEIEDRFGGELSFGTGGMRGVLGAGTRRMNIYVVRRATQGLADYLKEKFASFPEKKAVIAYDSRRFSREFALEASLVLAANGIKAFLFRQMRPTPQLSFSVRELGCQGGIIITASHNPPEYNGYKVYGADGGQLVSEQAKEVTAAIKKIHFFNDVKLISREEAEQKGLLVYLGEEMDRRYLERIRSLSLNRGDPELGIVYTPLHGTGIYLIPRLFKEMGYTKVHVVESQAEPDPLFSTVRVPNPEERESFNLALELAAARQAELILATDPDADRVGCAVRNSEGGYELLSGNQVGALLVAYLLEALRQKQALPPNGVIIKTIVTGNMGREIAASYGIPTVETLTGFKFIAEKIEEFEQKKDYRFIFGYEESYGYLAGTFVRDKDAVIASALIAEMASFYRQRGQSLLEVLEDLYRRYGYFKEDLFSVELAEQQLTAKLLQLFSDPALQEIAGIKIEEKRDYRVGKAWNYRSQKEYALSLPASDVLHFTLADGSWFAIRPSGTEPKIKLYFAVRASSAAAAAGRLAALKEAVLARVQQVRV